MLILTDVQGAMREGGKSDLPGLLAQLSGTDPEHADVSIQTPSGICLSLFGTGLAVVEDVEDDSLEPHWCHPASEAQSLRLMELLADEDVEGLMKEQTWTEGYGPK